MQFICDEHMLFRTASHHHFVGRRVGAIQSDHIKQYPAGHHAPTGQEGNFKKKIWFLIDVMSSAFTFCNRFIQFVHCRSVSAFGSTALLSLLHPSSLVGPRTNRKDCFSHVRGTTRLATCPTGSTLFTCSSSASPFPSASSSVVTRWYSSSSLDPSETLRDPPRTSRGTLEWILGTKLYQWNNTENKQRSKQR